MWVSEGFPLGNCPLDRLANASYQKVIKGNSYREKLSPHRKLVGVSPNPPKDTDGRRGTLEGG